MRVLGHDPHRNRDVQRSLAMVPEDEAVPPALTARQLVRYTAALHRVADRDAPDRCLATVTLLDVADRRVGGFSKGMRQRAKIAAALVSEPQVLVLDEPLNGADPVQRVALIDLFRALGDQGRTVIVSSHVLHEVERLACARSSWSVVASPPPASTTPSAARWPTDPARCWCARHGRELRGPAGGARCRAGRDRRRAVRGGVVAAGRRAGRASCRRWAHADARLLDVRPLDDSLESVFRELLR